MDPSNLFKFIKCFKVGYFNHIIILFLLLNLYFFSTTYAQFDDETVVPENVVSYEVRLEPEKPRPGEHARVVVDLQIHKGWHVFSVIPGEDDFAPIPTSFILADDSLILIGPVYESNTISAFNSVLNLVLNFHEEQSTLFQNIMIPIESNGGTVLKNQVKITYQACSDRICLPPKTNEFSLQIPLDKGSVREKFSIPQFAVDNPPADLSTIDDALREGVWGFIGLAIIAGFLALLTPCVFPMIPITVAFFTKNGEANTKETIRLATLFGTGIVITYTVTGMLLSIFLGAAGAVQFATNGWVNLVIGIMFTIFAFSMMGFIELNAPLGLGRITDRWSRSLTGPLGVLAMGLAFTLTSFTCTVEKLYCLY